MKKILSYIVALTMILSLFPVQLVGAAGTPTITVGSAAVSVAKGEQEIYLPINIANNPGVAAFDMSVTIPEGWEIAVFDYINETAEVGSIFAVEGRRGFNLDATEGHNEAIGKFIIGADNTKTADGAITWVVFVVPADAINGDYEIKIENVAKICNAEDTTADIQSQFTFVPGTVTISGGKEPPPKPSVEASMFAVGAAPEYNGEMQTAVITSTLAESNYKVSGNTATNAGKYTATITGKNEYQGSVELTWEIAPKTVDSVDWADLALTYNGKTQIPTASFEGVGADGKIAVKVEGNGVNVGAYTATAVSAENANYKLAAGLTQEYAIEPSDKVNAVVEAEQKVAIGENAELYAPQFVGIGDEKVEGDTVYLMGCEVVPDAAAFDRYAFTYDVVNTELAKLEKGTTAAIAYRFQASGNYKAELFGIINVEMVDILFKVGDELATIDNAVAVKDAPEYGDKWAEIFAINDIKAVVGNDEIDGEFTVEVIGTDSETAEVGTFEYVLSFVGGGYEMTVATGTVTVVPKTVAVVWENTELTYTGEAQAPKAYYMDVKGEHVDVTVKADQAINVGEYNAIASGDDANYTLTNTETKFDIHPAEVELSVAIDCNQAFVGEGAVLTAVVEDADKYELRYRWLMDGEFIPGADTATYTISDAEPYTVIRVEVAAYGNYAGEGIAEATVIAAPEAPVLTASKVSSTYVTVSWTEIESNGAEITGYAVKVGEDGDWFFGVAADSTEYTFEGLAKGEIYTFFVKATSNAGDGAVASIEVKTKVPSSSIGGSSTLPSPSPLSTYAVYVLGIYDVLTRDNYGNDVTYYYAQGVDMAGNETRHLVGIDYAFNTDTLKDLGETSARSINQYATFRMSTDKDMKNAGVWEMKALGTAFDPNYPTMYTGTNTTENLNYSTSVVNTTAGELAFITPNTKFIVVDGGLGEKLETAVVTGGIRKTATNADMILSQDDNGAVTVEAMVIFSDVNVVSDDYIFVSDAQAAAGSTIGKNLMEYEVYFTKSGEVKTISIETAVPIGGQGFFAYEYDDTENTYKLYEQMSGNTNLHLYVDEVFSFAHGTSLVSTNIKGVDAADAKIIDVRSAKELDQSDVAEMETLQDMMDTTSAEYEVTFSAVLEYYPGYNIERVTAIFITDVAVVSDSGDDSGGGSETPPSEDDSNLPYSIDKILFLDKATKAELDSIPTDHFLVEVQLTNHSSEQMGTVLLVSYTKAGQMVDMRYMYGTSRQGDRVCFGTSLDNQNGQIGKVKAFVLTSLGGQALAESLER